ncbi:hypothetical protein Hanom_Chr06g00558701 [Helianthus anomalus]
MNPTHYLITKIVYLLSPLLSLLILQNPNGDFNKNLPPFLFIPANKSCGRLNNSLVSANLLIPKTPSQTLMAKSKM